MSLLGRNRWFAFAGGITLTLAVVALLAPRGPGLTSFADFFGFAIVMAGAVILLINALNRPRPESWFWRLMALGFFLWSFNQGAWAYHEIVLHVPLPDPYFADIILFFHLVPMIAAVTFRPDRRKSAQRLDLSTLNFLTLLVWWMFLYAFLVFPHQYVLLNVPAYDRYYDVLYEVENVLLVVILGGAVWNSTGAWKRLYLNFCVAAALYAVSSQLFDEAVVRGTYYSGSIYDVPMTGAIVWMMATALSARDWNLEAAAPDRDLGASRVAPRLAMLAILSLPVLGLWTLRWDHSPAISRTFRLLVVLATMLVLGAFVFLRQYLQDQALIGLLEESRQSFENEQRLQSHLVQREKLASLGHLVAGAAREIDDPLTAIMVNSEKLWSTQRLNPDQDTLVRKIVNHANRTRELVANLLSFARQSSGEKTIVDLAVLLPRSVQMLELQRHDSRIRVETIVQPNLPRVLGNGNQLFQAFVQIVENALDALEEAGGGSLQITAQHVADEIVLHFSDSGTGIRDPHRVFDPFYTTKPIGKGTGLGLSAVYGVVQDHRGQITCQNKPGGGALFTVRLPVASAAAHAAGAKA
ncbi:MAG TPA: ATP-binding protein [Candidatus Aquilonibacter sp.]|nr:ATP-binding protein [Candidatus Aquilonibacter sp.]